MASKPVWDSKRNDTKSFSELWSMDRIVAGGGDVDDDDVG